MGLNEYGKRLEVMHSQSCSVERKKQRLVASNCLHLHSSLLDTFERRKKELTLPFRQRTDPFRSPSANESSVSRLADKSSLPFYSPKFGAGQAFKRDAPMSTTQIGHPLRSQLNGTTFERPQVLGIAQRGFHFRDDNGSPSDFEHSGKLLQSRWMKERDNLRLLMEEDKLREKQAKELEEFKKRVEDIDRESYRPPLLATSSADIFKNNRELPETSQLADEPTSSTAAVDTKVSEVTRRIKGPQVWKQKYEESHLLRDARIKDLEAEIQLTVSRLTSLQVTKKEAFLTLEPRPREDEKTASVAFTPLSEEEEEEVQHALYGHNGYEVLAMHKKSNIDITRSVIQCLKPGTWLNDDVINLYMELLKERELREPKQFLKCHFFNTFFFNKLYKDTHMYDYRAVRRWTTQKKLGYNLLECDKIFVPIHKDIHWCLAVINVRDKKFQYLDSLKGRDRNVLQTLARYVKDEAKDKLSQNFDVSSWDQDYPQDIPEQLNGCDCGMFMIKYADFYSWGDDLKFTQEHMEYFRKRTVLELLQLKAR